MLHIICIGVGGGSWAEILPTSAGGRLCTAKVPYGDEYAQGSPIHRWKIRHQRYR